MQTLPTDQGSVTVPSRSQRQAARLIERYRRTSDRVVRAELVARCLPLPGIQPPVIANAAAYDDVVQVASYALGKAIDRNHLDRGPVFSSFAVPTFLGELSADVEYELRHEDFVAEAVRPAATDAEITRKLGGSLLDDGLRPRGYGDRPHDLLPTLFLSAGEVTGA